MGNRSPSSIIFLDRHRLDYHGGNVAGVVSSVFVSSVLHDIEVVQYESLKAQIHSFITLNKIVPTHITIVLSRSICFESDIPFSGQYEDEPSIQRFLDAIPFEHVGSKTIRMEKATRIVAANRDFYEVFQQEFQRHGFTVNAVIPANLLNLPPTSLANGLDLTIARHILAKVDGLTQLSLVATSPPSTQQSIHQSTSVNGKNTRPVILSIIFFLLLVVLAVMLKNYLSPLPTNDKSVSAPPVNAVSSPTIFQSEVPLSSYTEPTIVQ